MGTHVGPATAHTTHRTLDLSFRMLVALQGHAGLEWDITRCTPEELDALSAWSGLYRELRPLLHSGDLVRADLPDEQGLLVTGTVAPGGEQAAYTVLRTHTGSVGDAGAGRRCPGSTRPHLHRAGAPRGRAARGDPGASARPGGSEALGDGHPGQRRRAGQVGLALPVLAPAQGFLLHLT